MSFVVSDLRRDGSNGGTDWQVSATHDDNTQSFDKPYQSESQKPQDIKVVLLGAPGVGKTAIAQVCSKNNISLARVRHSRGRVRGCP